MLDAKLVKDKDKIYIKDEVIGDKIEKNNLYDAIKNALSGNKEEFTLADKDYTNPTIVKTDKSLLEKLEKMNKIYTQKYTFDFEDEKFELTGEELYNMYEDKEDGLELNKEAVTEYVKKLASKTNTYAKERKFNATGIGEVTVPPGIYGWRMDVVDTTKKLFEKIKNGEEGEVKVDYIQTAKQRGKDDIGGTYVEIDLSRQHMWMYKDGKLLVDTSIVSGDLRSKTGSTPVGTGMAWAKIRNKTLKGNNAVTGEAYEFPTKYFIPFGYTSAGLHDNSVRHKFGGEIYKKNGSSSCINTPPDAMKTIFENLPEGSAVVIYESTTNYSPTDFERYEQIHRGN